MSADSKELLTKFTDYLSSSGKLSEIKTRTVELDTCISDSYKLMRELHHKFRAVETLPDPGSECPSAEDFTALHDQMSKFLEADPPRLLPENMKPHYDDMVDGLDIERVFLDIDKTLQEVKTQLAPTHNWDSTLKPQTRQDQPSECDFTNDLERTAASFENLSKRLANFKSIKGDGNLFQKDLPLEDKLKKLMHYVQQFSKMVEFKTKISQANMPIETKSLGDTALRYDETIRNLLGTIHELSFLIQNKK